jgi:plastocyanin
MFTTKQRRAGKGTLLAALVSIAIVLGACATTSPQPASLGRIGGSPIPTPSEPAIATTQASPLATPGSTAMVTTVTIRNRSFGAPEITVAVGKVTFVNVDTVPHTVSEGENGALAPNARFNVVVGAGESVQVTFAQAGDYRITCLFHSEMHLLVHAR